MTERNRGKGGFRVSKKRRVTEVFLGIIFLGFIIYKFSLYNYFSFVIHKDAKAIIRDFERNYLYSESLKNEDYRRIKEEILNSSYTTKDRLEALVETARKAANDSYSVFAHADLFKGKLNYSIYEKLRYEGKSLDGNTLYIKINTFAQRSDAKFLRTLEKIEDKSYLVLDLRDNNKGDYNEAVELADSLLPEGAEICYIEQLNSKQYFNSDAYINEFKKVFVLLNEGSGYCSELVALALKENLGDKAELIGNNIMQKPVGLYYKSYYNKIDMNVVTLKWFVKNKSSEGLNPYLLKYKNVKLENLEDYMSIVNKLKG